MKVCPKCFLQYPDEENFCFNDGTVLETLSESQEQETIIQPILADQLVKCRNCETENKVNSKFCKKCGTAINAVNQPFFVPLSEQSEAETVVVPQPQNPNFQQFPNYQTPPQEVVVKSDNTVKYILGGIAGLLLLILVGMFIIPSNKTKNTANNSNSNKKAVAKDDDDDENSANTSSSSKSDLIGKIGYLNVNSHLRSCADRSCPSVGIHFENAKIKILDVQDKASGSPWYKIEVLEVGCHTLNTDWCGKQYSLDKFDSERTYPLASDKNAQDSGWIKSNTRETGEVVRF
jgi:hypothetical protein